MNGRAPILQFRVADFPLGVTVDALQRLDIETPLSAVPFAVPALAGLGRSPFGLLPILDLRGLITPEKRPPLHIAGATVAVLSTDRGVVGLRMDALVGTVTDAVVVSDHDAAQSAVSALPAPLQACVSSLMEGSQGRFFYFSPEALLVQLRLPGANQPSQSPI